MARNEEWEKHLQREYEEAIRQGYGRSDALYDRLAEQAIQRMRERDRKRAAGEDIKDAYQKKYEQLIMDAMAANAQAMSDKLWSKEEAAKYKITVDDVNINSFVNNVKFNANSKTRPPDFDHYQDALKWAMDDVQFRQQYGPDGRSRAVPVDPKWGYKKDIGGPNFRETTTGTTLFDESQRWMAAPSLDPLLRKRVLTDLRSHGGEIIRWSYYHDVLANGMMHWDTRDATIRGVWALPFWHEPIIKTRKGSVTEFRSDPAGVTWGIAFVDDTGRCVSAQTWFLNKKKPPCDWKNLQVLPKNPVLG